MKIRIKAPEGYKYRDTKTGRLYSELVIDSSKKDRFELVADNTTIIDMEG